MLPAFSSDDVVHISHFTLIDVRRAEMAVFQERQEKAIVPLKVGPDGLFIAGIESTLAFLAPVLYEPIVLNLDHLVPRGVRKPQPWHGLMIECLQSQSG